MKKLAMAIVLALGLCAFAALPASAESGTREAEITYRCIKLVLDGQEICPRDAAGNEVEPFILDGTTYLPVRAVADALGLDVRWRGSDSTVMLRDTQDDYWDYFTSIEMPPGSPEPRVAQGHNGTEKVTLAYRDIRLLIDGVVVEPKDAEGNAVEPFILDGTTYLPVRSVASALGLAVDWDAATGTVRLSHWLISRCHTDFDDGGGNLSTEETYEYGYDGLGRPVYYLSRQDTSSIYLQGTDSYEKRWSYDESGRLARLEINSQELDGSITNSVTSYVYDGESGLCISAEMTEENKYDWGPWQQTVKTEYEYDGLGRLVRAVQSSNGEQDFIDEWTYDEAGRITGLREKYYGDKLERTKKYTYDGEGRLTLVDHETRGVWSGEPYSYGWQEYFGYDADGRKVVYGTRGYEDGDVEERNVYDGTGRLIRKEYGPYGEECAEEDLQVTEYFYDERGLLTRERTSDGAGYENEYVYTYDELGRCIRLGSSVFLVARTWEYVKYGG